MVFLVSVRLRAENSALYISFPVLHFLLASSWGTLSKSAPENTSFPSRTSDFAIYSNAFIYLTFASSTFLVYLEELFGRGTWLPFVLRSSQIEKVLRDFQTFRKL